jgi:hypothetical protein
MVSKKTLERIRALAEDERGDPATRAMAKRKFEELSKRDPKIYEPSQPQAQEPVRLPVFKFDGLTIRILRRVLSVRYRHGNMRLNPIVFKGYGFEISGSVIGKQEHIYRTIAEAEKAAREYAKDMKRWDRRK